MVAQRGQTLGQNPAYRPSDILPLGSGPLNRWRLKGQVRLKFVSAALACLAGLLLQTI